MRDLLRADIRRISRMWLIYIGLFIAMFYIDFKIDEGVINNGSIGFISGVQAAFDGAPLALFVVFPVFYAVFAHELSSKSMQCILGHGITRDKLIATKLLDAAIVLAAIYIAITVWILYRLSDNTSVILSSSQKINLIIFICLRWVRHLGYIAFSAMIMYLSNFTALGVISCLAFTVMFKFIFKVIEFFAGLSIYDYTFDGLLDWAYTGIEVGGFAWQLIPAAGYIIAALVITIIFFRRKEFDF